MDLTTNALMMASMDITFGGGHSQSLAYVKGTTTYEAYLTLTASQIGSIMVNVIETIFTGARIALNTSCLCREMILLRLHGGEHRWWLR